MNTKILKLIKQFLELEEAQWIHIKVTSPLGKRELFIPNGITPEILNDTSPVETNRDKFTRIFNALRIGEAPVGDSKEWWKGIQATISQSGTKPQVKDTDSLEEALQKAEKAGVL